jgi:hypothetical protein
MAVTCWREYLIKLVLGSSEREWWYKFLYAVGINSDLISERMSQTLRAGWTHRAQLPGDILQIVGRDRDLEQYPAQTNAQFQAAVDRAWADWQFAGDETSIEGQLAAAGFIGAQVVFHVDRLGPHGEAAPYWSQFWVSIPSTSVSTVPPVWGEMVYGCFQWGVWALSPEDAAMFWAIVRKFKPVDHVCRGIELR